jgi:uncharacterized protein involved in exopolysaccharide biosynthesis
LTTISEEIQPLNNGSDLISFRDMFAMLWRTKWFIIIFTAIVAVVTVFYALSLPNQYRASSIYLPKSADERGSLSKLAGQFGGIASMAGISLGGGGTDKTAAALKFMKSRAFLQSFIERHDLLVPLMAAQGWDPETNELLLVPEIYDRESSAWVRAAPPGFAVIPSYWEAYAVLDKLITINEESKKGFITIELEYYSPELAAQWLGLLVQDLNAFWKKREHEQSQKTIEFLTEQAENAQLSELKSVFYQLIAEQVKSSALSEVSDEVLFETMAPVVIPEEKSAPSRGLLCIVGTFIGGVMAVLLSLLYCAIRPLERSRD